jgi:hypothetical protein
MLQELAKKTFRSSLKWTVLQAVVGLLLTAFSARDAFYNIKNFHNFLPTNAFHGSSNRFFNKCFPIFLFALGIYFLCLAVYRLIKGARGGFLGKLKQDIKNSGYTKSAIESDYASAKLMDKWGVRLGRLMIYDTATAKVRAISTAKMLWAYTDIKVYQTKYGGELPVNALIIYAEGEAKEFHLVFSQEAHATQTLQLISEKFPWVVIGYSDNLKRLIKENPTEFMKLRYHTCEHIPL